MAPGKRSTQIAAIRWKQETEIVLRVLRENMQGLTALEIATLVDLRLRKNLLLQLHKEGLIKQRKGLSSKGRISVLYVLNEVKRRNN
jgi:hypothetical protein